MATMSRTILRRFLNKSETPVPNIVLVTDSAEVCGRGIIYSMVKSHISSSSDICYLSTVLPPSRIKSFIKDEDVSGNLKIYDGSSDPCGWENGDDCCVNNLSKPLHLIFGGSSSPNGSHKRVLVVDKLDDLINHQDSLTLIRSLHRLSTDENVEQLLLFCGRDVVPENFMSAICHIALAAIHIEAATPCRCKIVLRKPSGKVLQSYEEFTLTPDLEVQDNRTVEKSQGPQEENNDAILAAQTTFNLSLTEDQRRSKNMLLLPHTRVQSSGGQIHYTPDDVDDWDEEDPDDDLDI